MILDPFNPDKVKERILGFGAVHPSRQYLSRFLFSFQSGGKSPVQTPAPACPHMEPLEAGASAKGRDPPLSELLSYWNVLCTQLRVD